MNILITGLSGFVGQYLLEEIVKNSKYQKEKNLHLFGTSHSNFTANYSNLQVFQGDLTDSIFVDKIISVSKPDLVFHLAAKSSGEQSFTLPTSSVTDNLIIELNLFEALRTQKLTPKILIVGSAEEYGIVKNKEITIDENFPLHPASPYAFSKVAQDLLAETYYHSYQMRVVRVRPFNHTGPGQKENFVLSSFAKQIAEIEKGKQKPIIKVGNLEAIRDFTDVRDIVKAYLLALEKCTTGEVYNIGSGRAYAIKDLLTKLINFSESKIKIEVDQKKLRPIDIPATICNYKKFLKVTSWKPEISIEKTLNDILNYWRNHT